MLTVVCVHVQGNVPYPAEYVSRLRSMVARNLKRPHRFVCLTDRPALFIDLHDTIKIETPMNMPGWWAKIQLFNPAHDLGERTLYLDLDVLPVTALDPIVDFKSRFALVPPAGTFKGRGNLRTVRRYNSSVMVWDRHDRVHMLHHLWTSAVALRLWGDQDFIGEVMPNEDTMPIEWFPRLSEIKEGSVPPEAKVILCKVPKNHEAARLYPWVKEIWR